MTTSKFSFGFIILFSLLLIGCNRGCTTAHTIASESKTFKTKGGNTKIVARVVDYRHSRRRGNNIFNRSITHSYGLSFDLEYGTFRQEEFFTEGVKDPNSVDLDAELTRAKVVVSNDQKHIGLGIDNKVVDIIHLYQSARVHTKNPELIADGTMAWSDLDINSYPAPEKILTETLENNCDMISIDKQAMTAFCDSRKPSDKVHEVLLNKWPECSFSSDYLTVQKIQKLSKNKQWKERATKRGLKTLRKKESFFFNFEKIVDFSDVLNSYELNKVLDSLLLAEWGSTGSTNYTKAILKRAKNNRNPMSKHLRNQLLADAGNEFDKFMRSGESNHTKEASKCLRILSELGDTTAGYRFVQDAFGINGTHYDTYDFLEVAYDNFKSFTDAQQDYIVRMTPDKFDKVKDYHRSSYFNDVEDIMDCAQLKRWKKKYPEDLDFCDIPERCGGK